MPKSDEAIDIKKDRITFREFFVLLWINFVVSLRNILEFFKVAYKYYGSWQFLKEDVSLRLMYLFHSPYSISKRFLMAKGEENVYVYGETPLTTLEIIAKEAEIGPKDKVVELGCGRGRTSFWLNSLLSCKVKGIEFVPEFVDRANRIKNRLKISGLEFLQGDFLKADTDLKGGTIYYLYGSALGDEEIKKLCVKFSKLTPGTKIITVSYPLTDYSKPHSFEIIKHFTAPFTWGEADVYIQVVL